MYFLFDFLKSAFSLRLALKTERSIFLAVSFSEAVGHANFSSASFH